MKKRQITRGTIRKRVPKKKGIDLSQRYIKQSKLGQGAFGLVYSAFDQETSKIVAIKCLTNKDSIDSFKDELDLLKRLHHSAIVPYLDSFLDSKGSLQIVMEYAEGGSLLDIIHKYGTLNEQVAAIYVSQILKGLVYLHKQNVIHRDIKAANVLFQGGIAKLADFGLALDLNDYGHTLRECAGSPYWMAPEVINNDPVNQKSDIWSVGATTYELLKGYPPFFEMAPVPAMFQIAGPRPMPIPHDISELCYDFLSQCFQKDPKLRPEAITLLKHPWIQQSLQYVEQIEGSFTNKNKKQSQDFKKLSLRLEF
ncbi:STE family protein kinase [Histomonas meleagridis]|uniref:STE family protein kinase n=1 Tax=Histomonas meleagridis TaxID=135588 RepID=UPI00355A22A8|nr:STE family protein kinase [Histomonas meleagridis]KAH0802992.1 STE family protein kinase [Histomonas meleagridis]